MIPVYFGRRHKVIVEDFVWQVVECEHCDLEWAFQVRCGGIGEGVSPYFLDERGARERARESARHSLEQDRQLAREGVARNVACPGCNRYQSEMVESLRRTHESSLAAVALVCMLFGSLLALRAMTESEPLATSNLGWTAPSALLFVAGTWLLVRRSQLRLRFDPNAAAGSDAPSHSSPYRRSERSPRHIEAGETSTSPHDGPAVITRAQYEAAPTGRPPIQWRRQ